eukprot:TRINITY_DN24041_c0_g1_i1.p1 TRINITY_DN24041_c0_g1~~TRINITY_DN24041_c0_g1_i1.p1  ORF type:complete len:299 (-),score=47.02 TRINITY_DN24041_c0_g1_i1:623-1519(-)
MDIKQWTTEQVHGWLLEQGFQQYADSFAQAEIDGQELAALTQSELRIELGIAPLGIRKKIIRAIETLPGSRAAYKQSASEMRAALDNARMLAREERQKLEATLMATAKSQGLPPPSADMRTYDSPARHVPTHTTHNAPFPTNTHNTHTVHSSRATVADEKAMVVVDQVSATSARRSTSREMLRAQVAAFTGRTRPERSYMSQAHDNASYEHGGVFGSRGFAPTTWRRWEQLWGGGHLGEGPADHRELFFPSHNSRHSTKGTSSDTLFVSSVSAALLSSCDTVGSFSGACSVGGAAPVS